MARVPYIPREATHAVKDDPLSTSMHVAEQPRAPGAVLNGTQHHGSKAGISITSNHASSVLNLAISLRTVKRPSGVIYAPGAVIVL